MSKIRSRATRLVGERVRTLRGGLEISQETLADLAGVHWTFVGQIERGERNVTLHNLVRLSDALGVDPGQLVTGLTVADLPAVEKSESPADRIRRERGEGAVPPPS